MISFAAPVNRALHARVLEPSAVAARVALILLSTGCDNGVSPRIGASPTTLWRVASGAPTDELPHSPAANGDRSIAYFATPDYRLKKVRGSDGQLIWDVDIGPPAITFPGWNVVVSGAIIAVTKTDVFAYDSATGAHRWTYDAPGGDPTGYTALSTDDSTIYAASQGGRLYAIDSRTGTARWITDLRMGRTDVGALYPVRGGRAVYVCSHSTQTPHVGALWSVDADSGHVKWRHEIIAELSNQVPWCYGNAALWSDLVIEPLADGRVLAFDTASGNLRWTAPRVHDVSRSLGDMRLAGASSRAVVVTSSSALLGMVVALDPATGKELWRNTTVPGPFLVPPVMDDTTAYVMHNQALVAYDVRDGTVRWRTAPGPAGVGTPFKQRVVVASDRLYVAGRDGSYAITK